MAKFFFQFQDETRRHNKKDRRKVEELNLVFFYLFVMFITRSPIHETGLLMILLLGSGGEITKSIKEQKKRGKSLRQCKFQRRMPNLRLKGKVWEIQ